MLANFVHCDELSAVKAHQRSARRQELLAKKRSNLKLGSIQLHQRSARRQEPPAKNQSNLYFLLNLFFAFFVFFVVHLFPNT